ncbi:ATP-binding sensor histidine kinase [Mastigocladopsis repens]|uniref:ATP-binding sensor histidine kinase n=1 Tax=Mastigocladopsis repens TaxID=221287 RepID=UPI00037C67C4|nr:ATP-binding sensor histidine kinase [Mastigocladopsis repens]
MFIHLCRIFPIPGYRISQEIYLGSKTLVYRGIREKDQQPVIIKLMRNEYTDSNEIAQFRNQYTITKNLDLPGIVKPLSLESYHNGYALVMEDFGGISLKEEMGRLGSGLGVTREGMNKFFHIAIQIASTLDGLQRHRIIHKDIKPANIVINPTTLEVKLIDFSIASLLPKEIQFVTNPNFLEGTLAYISPEQTGRMNRGIDYRSDFYSLGVTFFELLTGQLPFTTTDPTELVYCHIAKQPPKASSIHSNIPSIVSDIISKLMTKNAEDRYQSALGLKHDLELCFQQWQESKKIVAFKLGEQDISDRFLIPEKLYGRQHEVKTLLAAFERVTGGKTEMILVAGASGIGKTAIVNEVHKAIAPQHSTFIKGKFDQFQRDIPLSGLVQAFRDLIRQLLSETDAEIQQWQAKILSALGEQAQVIIDVIPQLEVIVGKQPPVAELSATAAQNRFNLLFQRFIKVFTTEEHSLVIFLDDLQWADTASLKFIQLLLSQSNAEIKKITNSSPFLEEMNKGGVNEGGLLLIGTYRDNEVSRTHPLYLTLNEIEKNGVTINTITLEALNQGDLNRLIADTLRCQEAVAVPLTQMVFPKTKGNPFFTNEFLKYLHKEGIIKFNFDISHWQCDIAQVKALALTDDVVEFMALQIEKLPKHSQKVLKLAACIGNNFDLKTLAIVHQKLEVDTAADLWPSLIEGLVLPEVESYKLFIDSNELSASIDSKEYKQSPITKSQLPQYKFVHDRVQQAAYSLIPEGEKQSIHLRIGQLLLNKTPVEELEEKIFDIVNQLNRALELITNQTERDALARMNLNAGRRAMASTAYAAAVKYLTSGIQLLPDDSWQTNYNLTLALYETAAEAAYLSGDFEQTEQLVEVVLVKAKTLLDQVKVYEVKIQAYGAQNKAQEAVNIALSFLKLLGIQFPENPSQSDVQSELEKTASNLANRRIEDLMNLPEMMEAQSLAVMRILSNVIVFSYQAVPELMPLICCKQINLSLKHGNAPLSALAYVAYGLMFCGIVGDIESGYQFGKLALSLLSKFQIKEVSVKVLQSFNSLIRPWKEHIRETLKPLLEVYSAGLETGDLEFAAYALYVYSYIAFFTGEELTALKHETATYSNAIGQIKQERAFHWNEIYRQTILNLLGFVKDPCRLIGEAYDEEKMLTLHLEANDGMALFFVYFCKLQLCYLLGKYSQALENAARAEQYLYAGIGTLVTPQFHFYDSLARLAAYPDTKKSEQKQILEKVAANQKKMQHWAHHAPMNYLHKFYLVEAERYWVLGQYLEAMEDYDRAITLAKEHEYINEEALANELAAKFYLEWGKQKIAQTYLTDAYYGYVRWGALAKVDDLEKRYPQLLAPIFQREKPSLDASKNSTSDRRTSVSTSSTNETVIDSNTSVSDSLDLAAVIKASQALSGEIHFEQLLSTLMQVVMENAGASKCALILRKGDRLYVDVTAVSSSSDCVPICTALASIPLESSEDVPITLINYVKRTQEIWVIDDATAIDSLATDCYIIREQPKSLLCIPIINQRKLLGILYLENNLTTAAFTRDRVELLKLITTQAAISLENAILYKSLAQANERLEEYSLSLEEKVAQRTQELKEKNQRLKQALKELQSTQTQLIQSEKMSSLGQIVAGIAHEINNSINFIYGNISHASRYVEDLLDLLAIYQQENPNLTDQVKKKMQEIDLDFLAQDLPKLLDSMNFGSSRIRNIILSLRNFSRLDESEMKPVNIHEGIDNTLMILQHRLQSTNEGSEIEVIKEYGQLPKVTCYAGQLNQVFMNILSNAIDALEQSFQENKATNVDKGKICIRTDLANSNVRIRIADNGSGMTKEVQQKIFDPFFTTKPIGSGTGLGLSISYQIVVDKHKGQLTCNSTPGQGTEFVIEIPMR